MKFQIFKISFKWQRPILIAMLMFNPFAKILAQIIQKTPFGKLPYSQIQKMTFEQIKEMAEQGDTDAEIQLAITYTFKKKNIPEGVKWYQKASDGGNGKGAWYLGELYRKKIVDGTENITEALKWYSKAVDQGDEFSAITLGIRYRKGSEGFPKSPEKAAYYFNLVNQKNNKAVVVWLAEMYARGEGVSKNTEKARELLSRLSEVDINEDVEAKRVLSELDGFEIKSPTVGNIKLDKPKFPIFYIWRGTSQESGNYFYKAYIVNSDGSVIEDNKTTVTYEEWKKSKEKVALAFAQAPTETPIQTPRSNAISEELVSSSHKWIVVKPSDHSWGNLTISFRDVKNSIWQKVNIPCAGWGWEPIGWNSNQDLFYFSVVVGTTTDRQSIYWQLNPDSKTFTAIGGGRAFNLNPGGNWVVWEDGYGKRQDDQIHVYDIANNRDFTLTSGQHRNSFYRW